MNITTIQKYIHTSPRKLRLVADMIRKMDPAKALGILGLTPKDAAGDLRKALQTVLANAKQGGMDVEKAVFKKIEVNESMKMRRFRAGTKGRARPYKKRMAHIKIVLSDEGKVISQKTEKLKITKEGGNKGRE
ncbi:50S ribosomal protein L22 [Candidatus Daviesbacteria bacterium RIFCSPLOWO2_02_FULL_41_8]|uniref:Large ribosomal subunit protein uL22 n=3 Tax=Candidatus Daviesiibacteriota TaxID=1752718 RepID=A0A1F5NLQ3_9BACT|nr:MAG: 50S ribosomal protein L22 [Candidatus Daviesbacteria bacterium RIFCSPHIGHO2_01_FULL_41_23]OGE32788.1 MAG: 50S ribosomal protein L22 [Candidatus Daviesbacteria bacterium RIFCSPHIGHO2_02_FULL_41_10]OGE62130.1 MAG: 50S ribosomal protein L22 [Candidatus Daviesbacteria bacterium RIFCSPLOWO2_01_FULL_41_32]OGE78611.1 MAG: 50S ribosomal protein L22 [Candidatus Daviesbacteria bacterium RIFCSPLOWO2_02_FULL_41_8]